jgi:hypothetical protein
MSDIKNQVQSIVETLENPPQWCEECDCEIEENEHDDTICPHCEGETVEISAYAYLSDALDIEWIVSNDKTTLLGARVLVCFGGPNVWIDTRYGRVDGHWWSESYNEAFTDTIGLADALEDLWQC